VRLPSVKRAASNATRSALFTRMEQKLAAELSNLSGVYLITPADISALYPVEEYDDPHGDELATYPIHRCFLPLSAL